jgi:hypothetical protein
MDETHGGADVLSETEARTSRADLLGKNEPFCPKPARIA